MSLLKTVLSFLTNQATQYRSCGIGRSYFSQNLLLSFLLWYDFKIQVKSRGGGLALSVNVLAEVIFFFKLKAKCPVFHFLDLFRTILNLIQPKINKKRQNFCCFLKLFLFYPLYDFRILVQIYQSIIQFNQTELTQKLSAKMLSVRCQNSRKSENTQILKVNYNFFLDICWKYDTSLQLLGIHDSGAFYSTL